MNQHREHVFNALNELKEAMQQVAEEFHEISPKDGSLRWLTSSFFGCGCMVQNSALAFVSELFSPWGMATHARLRKLDEHNRT